MRAAQDVKTRQLDVSPAGQKSTSTSGLQDDPFSVGLPVQRRASFGPDPYRDVYRAADLCGRPSAGKPTPDPMREAMDQASCTPLPMTARTLPACAVSFTSPSRSARSNAASGTGGVLAVPNLLHLPGVSVPDRGSVLRAFC